MIFAPIRDNPAGSLRYSIRGTTGVERKPAAKRIVGMIHVPALPGTPRSALSPQQIARHAVEDAELLAGAGVDALLLENMHDVPYLAGRVGPEITACMTRAALAVRAATPLPLGIQVLAAANREALAIALAADADFIRAEGYIFAHVADEGWMPNAQAGELLRYRRHIGAAHIRILVDIKKKHAAHAITADISIAEMARAAEFFAADGVIVTGPATGRPAEHGDLQQVRSATGLPLWVGSGVTPENLAQQWPLADGFIIGSSFKEHGRWDRPLSRERVERFMSCVRRLRESDGTPGVMERQTGPPA